MGTVVRIADKRPQATLDALKRLTGLEWTRIPESLINNRKQPTPDSNSANLKKPSMG